MKKKIFVRGPVLSQSGYGEQSRFALRALRSREDLFDIYIQPINWGKTGWIWDDNEFRRWMDKRILETQLLMQQRSLQPDMSLQITIPNEFEKICPINIGYTAGIETSKVAPQWLQKGNEMDKILVVSHHAKNSYVNTLADAKNEQTGETFPYRLTTPVEVVWENTPMSEETESISGFSPRHDFNFLCVSQMGPRKNLENTITWFVEEFIDQPVGLILKTNLRSNCRIDKEHVEGTLKGLLAAYPDRKCSVSLLHGDLSESQMRALYEDDRVKAMVNISHGEGFGLPMFEAARSALPVITVGWSGQVDFLKKDGKEMFLKVKHEMKPVQKFAVWDGVISADSEWAYADQGSFKMALRMMHKKYSEFTNVAIELQKHIDQNFSNEVLYEGFCNAILGKSNLQPEEVESISFCISTNGAKEDKTRQEITSIKRTMEKAGLPYEIILAGDVASFSDDSDLVLVDTPEDAHSGLLAKLRNNAGEKVTCDTIVFVDDDFIFPENWASRLVEYSKQNGWEVTANKILLPDGSRFWDRSTIDPHRLVDYDYPSYSSNLYQTGGFWIMRKFIYDVHKWNSSISINAEQQGGINEDIEMSMRMNASGIELSFDKENTVWHNDNTYMEFNDQTLKKELVNDHFGMNISGDEDFTHPEFEKEVAPCL